MAWADMRDRMHRSVAAHLKDGCAQYLGPNNAPPVSGIAVFVDHNLMQNGPDGLFETDAIGVSWRKEQLRRVDRGGVFVFSGRRLVVEETVRDDGHMATAACMEQS